jgi:hypothetical protein
MSRHEIPGFSPGHKIIVGWDPPLQTFFLQVIDREAEDAGKDDKFLLWLGWSLREICEVEQLVTLLSLFADVTPEMRAILHGDKDKDEGL